MKTYVIGAGAGFAGDRIEPAVNMACSGTVDAIALECLAERTLIAALRNRQANADSSLFAAAPVYAMGLDPAALAGALTLGHLLECSGQLSGGNLSEPGVADLTPEEYADIGYPIGELQRNGSAIVRLLDGGPGRINPVGCTLQLLYEVHDPHAYATPDGVLDFAAIEFEQIGQNRVRMTGARMGPRPERLKVIGFLARRGLVADIEIAFAGTGALARARNAAETLRLRLTREMKASDLRIDFVGVDSVLGAASLPLAAEPPELRVHVSARCDDADIAQMVEDEISTLTISGPAACGSVRSERRPRIESIAGFIARDRVPTHIEWGHE